MQAEGLCTTTLAHGVCRLVLVSDLPPFPLYSFCFADSLGVQGANNGYHGNMEANEGPGLVRCFGCRAGNAWKSVVLAGYRSQAPN
jgi:hypothetical protein